MAHCVKLWAIVGAVTVAVFAETSMSVRACYLSTEPDPAGRGKTRFVLSPADPCTCSEVRFGGHNTQPGLITPPVVYLYELPDLTLEGIQTSLGCPLMRDSTVGAGTTGGLETTPASTVSGLESTPVVSTNTPQPPAADCQGILDADQDSISGVYTILHEGQKMQVYCRMVSGKGYIVFQRRQDGSVSFDRTWQEYADGFGTLTGEFWLGNDKLRSLTEPSSEDWELLVTVSAFDGREAEARFDGFSISGQSYALNVDLFVGGEAGDSLSSDHQRFFTTRDQDNDNSGPINCASKFQGGWWYNKCKQVESNLNGVYHDSPAVADYEGVQWNTWISQTYSLKSCEMKMRRA